MKINVGFKIKLYANLVELFTKETICMSDSMKSRVYSAANSLARDLGLKEDGSPNDQGAYDLVAKYLCGDWVVVGTDELYNLKCFVIGQSGRPILVIPTLFCKFIGTIEKNKIWGE